MYFIIQAAEEGVIYKTYLASVLEWEASSVTLVVTLQFDWIPVLCSWMAFAQSEVYPVQCSPGPVSN